MELPMKLLHVDSSARDSSVSRAVTTEFVAAWERAHPDSQVIRRDLAVMPLSHVTDDWVQASQSDPTQHTEEQRRVLALSETLVSELHDAVIIVVGSPMYNFAISAALKAWIDLVVRQGRTVDFSTRPPKGLLQDKKLVVITARGGNYDAGTPTADFDFQEPYLRLIFGLIGLKDIRFIHVDNQRRGEEAASAARHKASAQITAVITETLQAAA
jgi:FMN-dependent NADH-azoreductase